MSDTTKSVYEINIIVRRIINDTKTGVIDLLDDNGRGGLYHAIEDLTQLFTKQLEEAKIRVARNAMAIVLDWLENDGRGKHLVQDMWDVRDISVLDHIEQRFIDEAIGHFPAILTQDTKGGTDEED